MIKAVLFDLDGLLIDSEVIFYQMGSEMAAMGGGIFSMEDYVHHYMGRTLQANMQAYIDMYHLDMTVQEAVQWTLTRERELTRDGVPLKAGARDLIRHLQERGIKRVLATSSLPDRAERFLKLADVYDCFDDYVYGSEVTRGKPDPETFLIGAEKAGVNPAHCLVLEDSENGVRAAHAGGFPVICVPDLKKPSPDVAVMANAVVKSLADVIPLLDSL